MVVDAGFLEGCDLGSIEPAHDLGIGVHRQAVQRGFGKHHEVHGSQIAPRFADHVDDAFGLACQILLGDHDRKLQLHEPDDHAFGRFVQPAKSIHVWSP